MPAVLNVLKSMEILSGYTELSRVSVVEGGSVKWGSIANYFDSGNFWASLILRMGSK